MPRLQPSGDRRNNGYHDDENQTYILFSNFGREMNLTEKVTKWVEKKVGRLVEKEIDDKINSENLTFDVDECAEKLLNAVCLYDEVIKDLKDELMVDSEYHLDFDSDDTNKSDVTSQDSLDCEHYDFQTPSLDEMVSNLENQSQEVKVKALEMLEASPAEELIVQTSWTMARKILQDMLRINYSNKEIPLLVLKVFRRFLMSYDAPKIICEGFITLAESIHFHIEMINLREATVTSEEIYDFKENKWFNKNSEKVEPKERFTPGNKNMDVEILMRSMWLLIEAQKSMPGKWIRFNEKRLREIIFSFIHLLSSNLNSDNNKVSGLEIVSVLTPVAVWCRHWCHGATGRTLLCSTLRRHKKLFSQIIEIILNNLKNKQVHYIKARPEIPIQPAANKVIENKKPKLKMLRSVSEDENANVVKTRERKKFYKDKSFDRNLSLTRSENKSSKIIHSAPSFSKHEKMPPIACAKSSSPRVKAKPNAEWIINGIPRFIVDQAVFCHCFTLVTYVIQYRAGRSLFPVNTTSRKRQLTVQDLVTSMINYAENLTEENSSFRYKQHMTKMLEILKKVETSMHPSRINTQRAQISQR